MIDAKPRLTPLLSEGDAASTHSAWQRVAAKAPESCRWAHADGRFVSVTLGRDDELCLVIVADSAGRRESVGSYEEALTLAKAWRVE